MPISEAQKRATMKYMKNNYDRIELKVDKGKKVKLQAHAEHQGESLNGFVNRAIDNQVKRDNEGERDATPVNRSGVDTKDGDPQ